jgi:hypothetical protein
MCTRVAIRQVTSNVTVMNIRECGTIWREARGLRYEGSCRDCGRRFRHLDSSRPFLLIKNKDTWTIGRRWLSTCGEMLRDDQRFLAQEGSSWRS